MQSKHIQEEALKGIEAAVAVLTDIVLGNIPATVQERLDAAELLLSLGWGPNAGGFCG